MSDAVCFWLAVGLVFGAAVLGGWLDARKERLKREKEEREWQEQLATWHYERTRK